MNGAAHMKALIRTRYLRIVPGYGAAQTVLKDGTEQLILLTVP